MRLIVVVSCFTLAEFKDLFFFDLDSDPCELLYCLCWVLNSDVIDVNTFL